MHTKSEISMRQVGAGEVQAEDRDMPECPGAVIPGAMEPEQRLLPAMFTPKTHFH